MSDVAEGESDATLIDGFNDDVSSMMDPSTQTKLPKSDPNTSKGPQIREMKESSARLLTNQNLHYAGNPVPFNSANTSSKLYTLPKLPSKSLSCFRFRRLHIQTPEYDLEEEDEEDDVELADYDSNDAAESEAESEAYSSTASANGNNNFVRKEEDFPPLPPPTVTPLATTRTKPRVLTISRNTVKLSEANKRLAQQCQQKQRSQAFLYGRDARTS